MAFFLQFAADLVIRNSTKLYQHGAGKLKSNRSVELRPKDPRAAVAFVRRDEQPAVGPFHSIPQPPELAIEMADGLAGLP
ncbi:hypothetical protein, partial [Arthrobacter sp. H41]|uniref:hypothetical protein n=1 Tax=Arthrobacter sp. H41 TaxID=1312978 RepID=UPI0031B7FA19